MDPWAGRADGIKCKTCIWFVVKKSNAVSPIIGRCRRRSPTMMGYPVVFPGDWCGDHKLDEGKIVNHPDHELNNDVSRWTF